MTPAFLRQLPRYQCHKQVSALKIKAVIPNPRGFELHFEDERFAPHEVPASWVAKHRANCPIDSFELLAGGYLVAYDDVYRSWSPAVAFESVYTPVETADGVPGPLDFGDAIRALKAGKRVARAGWNGKGMWLCFVDSDGGWSVPNKNYVAHPEFNGEPHLLPWIGMKTADNGFVPWLANQTDMLATDWVIL